MHIKSEDITKYIITILSKNSADLADYGYDIYLPKLFRQWVHENLEFSQDEQSYMPERKAIEVSPLFYNATWELCRKGILRPGVSKYQNQHTGDGSTGNGYSITPYGRKWLAEADKGLYVPTEEGRFAELLANYKKLFGEGFHQRAQEAHKCYGAHAYLACCVMCGACAEAILLRLAINKHRTEQEVIRTYSKGNGTDYLRKIFRVGELPIKQQRQFETAFDVLKYWRDSSSHGLTVDITETEAFYSLATVLRLAQEVRVLLQQLEEAPINDQNG